MYGILPATPSPDRQPGLPSTVAAPRSDTGTASFADYLASLRRDHDPSPPPEQTRQNADAPAEGHDSRRQAASRSDDARARRTAGSGADAARDADRRSKAEPGAIDGKPTPHSEKRTSGAEVRKDKHRAADDGDGRRETSADDDEAAAVAASALPAGDRVGAEKTKATGADGAKKTTSAVATATHDDGDTAGTRRSAAAARAVAGNTPRGAVDAGAGTRGKSSASAGSKGGPAASKQGAVPVDTGQPGTAGTGAEPTEATTAEDTARMAEKVAGAKQHSRSGANTEAVAEQSVAAAKAGGVSRRDRGASVDRTHRAGTVGSVRESGREASSGVETGRRAVSAVGGERQDDGNQLMREIQVDLSESAGARRDDNGGDGLHQGADTGDRSSFAARLDAPAPQSTARAGNLAQATATLARRLNGDLGDNIVRQARIMLQDAQRAEVRLVIRPPELGRVRIKLQMDNGHIAGRILVDNGSVRDVVEQNLSSLQRAFEEAGLEMGDLEVSTGDARDERGDDRQTGTGRGASTRRGGVESLGQSVQAISEYEPGRHRVNLVA